MPLGNREGAGLATSREPGDRPPRHINLPSVGRRRRRAFHAPARHETGAFANGPAAKRHDMTRPLPTLVIGGQKSGKSRYAEQLALASGLAPVYLATATAGDAEMAARIADHRARRSPGWTVIEEPVALAGTLGAAARPDALVLVECLTLWLSNLMATGRPVEPEIDGLIAALGHLAGPAVLVSNEVGSGIVPENALARRYTDALGALNQRVASVSARVVLVTAGLPLTLKGERAEIAA
jgi:adenosylcobinamide kinase/adenosylcobinamide-phosphate guanylyltransferase